MKIIHLSLLILLSIVSSCKSDNVQKQGVVTETNKPMTQTELGDLYQYYHANPTTLQQKDENVLIEYAADKGYKVERTHNGVFIVMKSEGSGTKIGRGERLKANYVGKFLDGKIFDQSKAPMEFNVGQMVAGWNEALITRKKGDKFILLIPSHMGYGKKGFPGYIGPDMNLHFDIEILDEG